MKRAEIMTHKKSDIVEKLTGQGMSKVQASGALTSLIKIMKDRLQAGESVLIRGFGKFAVQDGKRGNKNKTARRENTPVSNGRSVTFKPSPCLIRKINERVERTPPGDRRKGPRKNIEIFCSVYCLSGHWRCNGKICNISKSGACMDIVKVPLIRDRLQLWTIKQNGQSSIRKGQVLWLKQKTSPEVGARTGIRFIP
jgi:integration host factor subunit alpha